MTLSALPVPEFSEKLASSAPVPGGGGAAALVGALSASLIGMVSALTTGKPKYAAYEADLARMSAEAEALRRELLSAIDDDAEAFRPLAAAYGLPRDTENRAQILEKCLRDAAAAPFRVMELCGKALVLLSEMAEKGSKLAVSDVACGALFGLAAMEAAAVNVRVNTALMKDRAYAEKTDADTEAFLKEYRSIGEDARAKACGRIF